MSCLHLYAGIGGFARAAARVGFPFVNYMCSEIDRYCNIVLENNFPEMKNLGGLHVCDTKSNVGGEKEKTKGSGGAKEAYFEAGVTAASLNGKIHLITGGPPCQPWSTAGKQKKEQDSRNMWPETIRAISEIEPTWIILENVPGFTGTESAAGLRSFLEEKNYLQWWFDLSACSFGYPHLRRRVFIVARLVEENFKSSSFSEIINGEVTHHPAGFGWNARGLIGGVRKEKGIGGEGESQRLGVLRKAWAPGAWTDIEPVIQRGSDGLSPALRANIKKASGNAIIPEIAKMFFLAIREFDEKIS